MKLEDIKEIGWYLNDENADVTETDCLIDFYSAMVSPDLAETGLAIMLAAYMKKRWPSDLDWETLKELGSLLNQLKAIQLEGDNG